MRKAVTYSVVGRKNPSATGSGEIRFYAQAQARGEMGIREIAERIQQMCTVTRADVMGVLVALEDVVADGLKGGEIVRLGELGSLQVSLSGSGSEAADLYDDSLIERARVLFRPGQTLHEAITNLAYEQVPVKYAKKAPEEEEGEDAAGA